jgi:hypothetical protein
MPIHGVGTQNIHVSWHCGCLNARRCLRRDHIFWPAPQATAIAMAAGDTGNETKQLREELQKKIVGITVRLTIHHDSRFALHKTLTTLGD